MEDTETLLFEAVFDVAKARQNAELLAHSIAVLKKEKQETEKEFKKGAIGAEEYAKSIASIDTHLIKAQSSYKASTKSIADYDKQQKVAAGSIDEMRLRIQALIPVYTALSDEERENEKTGKALQAQIRALSDELKAQESAYGSNGRKVGSYEEAIVNASKTIGDAKQVGADYVKSLNVMGTNIGELASSLKNGYAGFQTFTKGIGLARLGMIALGAVPIVLFLTGLVAILTKTQAGLDFIERTTASVSAVFNVFINRSTAIAQSLIKIFTQPKAAVVELKNEILGLFGAAEAAAASANKIAASNQQLRESERGLNVERAKNRAEVERLKQISEDTSKSQAVRQDAAQKAYALEQSTLSKLVALQQQRIKNEKESLKNSTDLAADKDKVAEAEIALAEMTEESLGKQTELNNQLNSIRQEGIQKAREAAQLAAAESVAEGERALIRAKQKGIDTLAIEEELIRRRGIAEKAGIEKGAEQRKLVDARVNAEILELRVAHALEIQKQTSATEAASINSSLALARRGSQEVNDLQIREIRRQAKDQLAELEALHKRKLISEDDYNERLGDIQNTSNRAIDDKRNEFAAAEINRLAELGKLRIETENDLSNDLVGIRRNQAVKLIDIEEKQQLDLLKLEDLNATDRLVRQNAIQARAEALRKEQYRAIQADIRADRRATVETQIAETYGDNKKALDLQKRLLALQRDDELANTELSEKQKAAIKAKYRRAEQDLQRDYNKRQIDIILDSVSQSNAALGKLFDAQAQASSDLLESQQTAALKSAGLSADARQKIEENFAAKKDELDRKSAERRRKIATVENIISVARGVTEAIVKNIGNPIMQALQIALVIGTGAAQQAVIAAQKFARGGQIPDQKLALGGMVDGPSHAEGGVKYRIGRQQVELEGGEGVINKWAMRIPWVRRQASQLNQMAGNGVSFDSPGRNTFRDAVNRVKYRAPVRMETGGLTPTPASTYDDQYKAIRDALRDMPNPVVRVQSIRSGVDREVRVEQGADY